MMRSPSHKIDPEDGILGMCPPTVSVALASRHESVVTSPGMITHDQGRLYGKL